MSDFLVAIQQSVAGHTLSAMLEAAHIRQDASGIVTWRAQCDEDIAHIQEWIEAPGYHAFGIADGKTMSIGFYPGGDYVDTELLGAIRVILTRLYLDAIRTVLDFPGNVDNR